MKEENSKMDIDIPLKNGKIKSKIKCPRCHEIPLLNFKTSEKYKIFIDLLCPNNHTFETSLEVFLNNPKNIELKCSNCKANNLNLNELFYCKNCNSTLCSNCIKNHFDHMKLSLDKINNYCFIHNDNLFESYCEKCKQNLCEKCLNDHKEHEFDIKKFNKKFLDDEDRANNKNEIKILEYSIKENYNKKEKIIHLLNKLINKINEEFEIFKTNVEKQIILNKEIFSLYDEGFRNYEIIQTIKNFSDFISKNEIYNNINENFNNLYNNLKNLYDYKKINNNESDDDDDDSDFDNEDKNNLIKTVDNYDDYPFNNNPLELKFKKKDFPEEISFIRGSLSDSFCLFTSKKNENLIVYYNYIDEYSDIILYNLVTKRKKSIEKICKSEITAIKHFIRKNSDILLITTLDNILIVYNLSYNKIIFKIPVIEKKIEKKEEKKNNEISLNENDDKENKKNNDEKEDKLDLINQNERIYNPNYYENLIDQECILVSCYLNGVIKLYNFKRKNIEKYNLKGFNHLCYYMIYEYKNIHYVIISDWNGISSYNFKKQTLFQHYKSNYELAAYNCKIVDIDGVTNLIFGFNDSIFFYNFETGELIKQFVMNLNFFVRNIVLWNNEFIIINDEKSYYVYCIDIIKKQIITKYEIRDDSNFSSFSTIKKMKIGKKEFLFLQFSNQNNLKIMKIPDYEKYKFL